MKRALKIILIPIGVLLAVALGLAVYYFTATAGSKLEAGKLLLSDNAVTVYDAVDEKIETHSGESVRLSALPKALPEAFVAVEDKRFYLHHGLDFKRIAKAAWKNLVTFSFREGASTISQQLIKNTHLSGEKTIDRKLKEIKLTRALEKHYSKNEIMELYLNSIYFGHTAFGIANASRYYFGVEPNELSVAQCAMLAGLVKSPNRYSPFKDPERCLKRRNLVLSLMREQGYLSREEERSAAAEPLPETPCPEEKKSVYFTLVFDELARLVPDFRSGDALKVYTFLDRELQSNLEGTQTDSDCTILVRDSRTNGIKAVHSTCGILCRLPASTIKPLAVYAPALEENLISPATPILDEKTDFGGYSPSNYSGACEGYMSVRYALSRSVNIPAVKILNSLGTEKAARYLEKMELPVPESDKTLALALGGMSKGYSLPALADAYAVFQNDGKFSPSSLIRKICTASDTVLYDFETNDLKRPVFSEDVCALMNDMLMTAAREGTAKKLKNLPYQVCAKTGTGGSERGNTDAYTIAYTSEDLVAVWLGNRDNSPITATGGGIPCNIAHEIFRTLYREHTPSEFAPCEKVAKVALDREEYEKNHRILRADPASPDFLSFTELFRVSQIPEETGTGFSRPEIKKPLIKVKNGAVQIILCQTYYYDYEVKRESEGEISVIYRGKYCEELFDNSVEPGKSYTYTVTPYYKGIAGKSVTLPSVFIENSNSIPDHWWEERS